MTSEKIDRLNVQQAYIYGSFAKGTQAADSDIDLLLVGKETQTCEKLLKDLETRFGRTINVTTYALEEFKTKRQDKSEFLFEVMRSPLIQLKPELMSIFKPKSTHRN